jgi:hypothetical protein
MNLHVRVRFLKGFKGEKFNRLVGYRDDDKFVDVDTELFSEDQLDQLLNSAKAEPKTEGCRGLIAKITSYRNVRSAPEGKPIGKLELLGTALKAYIQARPNKWVFHDETDGYALPYYVQHIKYHPSSDRAPARVVMKLAAVTRRKDDSSSVTFYRADLGRTVSEILNNSGYYLETDAAVKRYLEDIEVYKEYSPLTGSQFRCIGMAYAASYYGPSKAMERDGVQATVVMDDDTDDGDGGAPTRSRAVVSNAFWTDGSDDDDVVESAEETVDSVVVPVHPYVQVFDLQAHEYVSIHVRNLTPYVYDKSAASKLILSRDTKDLVTILVQGSSEVLDDIIAGKTGGTIVIATGPPGTGKTLTAEVFSEEIERPLYVVQCSQLGTNEKELEEELQKVLTRASRWKAILLIDEADVYVHERGADIQQNAIVGVFLRVLEHYRGVLFMTSNRATIIDDAIMSRATAWIRYEYPNKDQLRELWTVLSAQYQMELSEKAITELVEVFPKLSGRNIKNLLKLARMLVRGKTARVMDVKLFRYVSTFLDLNSDEEKRAT